MGSLGMPGGSQKEMDNDGGGMFGPLKVYPEQL